MFNLDIFIYIKKYIIKYINIIVENNNIFLKIYYIY